jgi:hypothetical protein
MNLNIYVGNVRTVIHMTNTICRCCLQTYPVKTDSLAFFPTLASPARLGQALVIITKRNNPSVFTYVQHKYGLQNP